MVTWVIFRSTKTCVCDPFVAAFLRNNRFKEHPTAKGSEVGYCIVNGSQGWRDTPLTKEPTANNERMEEEEDKGSKKPIIKTKKRITRRTKKKKSTTSTIPLSVSPPGITNDQWKKGQKVAFDVRNVVYGELCKIHG